MKEVSWTNLVSSKHYFPGRSLSHKVLTRICHNQNSDSDVSTKQSKRNLGGQRNIIQISSPEFEDTAEALLLHMLFCLYVNP